MNFEIHPTPELFVLGGIVAILLEILRGLLLDIEKYPRIKAIWKYLPFVLGSALIHLYPSAAPVESDLIRLAHGAASPLIFAIAHPIYKRHFKAQMAAALGTAEKEDSS